MDSNDETAAAAAVCAALPSLVCCYNAITTAAVRKVRRTNEPTAANEIINT